MARSGHCPFFANFLPGNPSKRAPVRVQLTHAVTRGTTVGDCIVSIEEHQDDRGCHVVLRGRLDVRTVPDLRLTLHRIIADGSAPLLLDLAQAQVGDATGFGFLVESVRRARRAERSVHVVASDDRTRRLLRRGHLGSLLLAPQVLPVPEADLAGVAG